jgi:predicted transcriptional regulator
MKIFCETVFVDVLPALRAAITKELLEKYGMSQEEIAKRLGITQPAVSQYKTGIRGHMKLASNEKLIKLAKNLASEIASGSTLYEKICEICEKTRSEKLLPNEKSTFLCLVEMRKVKK